MFGIDRLFSGGSQNSEDPRTPEQIQSDREAVLKRLHAVPLEHGELPAENPDLEILRSELNTLIKERDYAVEMGQGTGRVHDYSVLDELDKKIKAVEGEIKNLGGI